MKGTGVQLELPTCVASSQSHSCLLWSQPMSRTDPGARHCWLPVSPQETTGCQPAWRPIKLPEQQKASRDRRGLTGCDHEGKASSDWNIVGRPELVRERLGELSTLQLLQRRLRAWARCRRMSNTGTEGSSPAESIPTDLPAAQSPEAKTC